MATLHYVKNCLNLASIAVFSYSLVLFSCRQRQEKSLLTSEIIQQFVATKIGIHEYYRMLAMASDSIRTWQQNQLSYWSGDTTKAESKLDSIVCINSSNDKMILLILGRELTMEGKLDEISFLYGAKVQDKWYFFGGPTQYMYRKDPKQPTSFAIMHEYAMQHIFRAYLKPDSTGQWQISEQFFGNLTSRAFCASCQTQEEWDTVYLQLAHNIWRYGQKTTKADSNRESSLRIEP